MHPAFQNNGEPTRPVPGNSVAAPSALGSGFAAPSALGSHAALGAYRRHSLEARVASASPHALVLMLYDRLLAYLKEAQEAATLGDAPRRLRATERALALVDGLDATLDDRLGGDVAISLHALYSLVNDRLLDGSATALGEARHAIAELAGAWRQIVPDRQVGALRV